MATELSDYDGDGISDVAVRRDSDSYILTSSGTCPAGTEPHHGGCSARYGFPEDVAVGGDFNGDGATDVGVWRPVSGTWHILGVTDQQWGLPGDVPVPGDYDGDGTTDLAVWRPSNGTWYVHGGDVRQWGLPGDIPAPGDFDGDGTTDSAVYRPAEGNWYIQHHDGSRKVVRCGLPDDLPVVGDYNGDGKSDPAIWRPKSGEWHACGVVTMQWGLSTDIPMPADYDGDGKTDFAVWRERAGWGQWFIKTAAGLEKVVDWGLRHDQPIVRVPDPTVDPHTGQFPRLSRDGTVLKVGGQPTRLMAYGAYGIVSEHDYNYIGHLDRIRGRANMVRIWVNFHWTKSLSPFRTLDQIERSSQRYDLTQFNDAYFRRLQRFVAAAQARGIIVQLTLFDGVAVHGTARNRWPHAPYNARNNINGFGARQEDYDRINGRIWTQSHVPLLREVVARVGHYGNVLWEIINEPATHGIKDAFSTHMTDVLYSELRALDASSRPRYAGSKLISVNATEGSLRRWATSSPKVDVVTAHVSDPKVVAGRVRYVHDRGKVMLLSADGDQVQIGDSTQTKVRYPNWLSPGDRQHRTRKLLAETFGGNRPWGSVGFEFLDKGLYGDTWISLNYNPDVRRVHDSILDILAGYLR